MEKVANYAQSIGKPASVNHQPGTLTDIEMPEMDGYILTKKIKSDPRFNGSGNAFFPVGDVEPETGLSVGVDEYVPKFEPQRLSETWRVASVSKPHRCRRA